MDKAINEIKKRRNLIAIIVLSVVSPFVALIFAIKNFRASWSKNVIWFYTTYFGYTFTIFSAEADASRYAQQLLLMSGKDFTITSIFTDYLSDDGGVLDFAQRVVTFLVAQITQDYRMLFAVFAFFLGYFLSRIIWFLIERSTKRFDVLTALIVISYSLVVGIWDIGGIRWNIAALIFFYGTILYIMDGNKNGLFFIFSTVFVHWSFPIAIVFFIVYVVFKNRPYIYFSLFVFSFFVTELNIDFFRGLLESFAPKSILNSRESYLNENYIELLSDKSSKLAWYILYYLKILKWLLLLLTSYIFIVERKSIENNQPLVFNLLNFGMFFYGVFNLLSVLPSVGRFLSIGNLLLLMFLFFYLQYSEKGLPQILRYISIPVLVFFIIIRIRIGFDFIGIWSVFGSPIFVYFVDNNLPLINLVKQIF